MKKFPALIALGCVSLLAPVAVADETPAHAFPAPSPELLVPKARPTMPKGMHPAVVLLDVTGKSVVATGSFVSFRRSCGVCHDAAWIGDHGYHFRVGVDERVPVGQAASGRAWDFGPGLFGRWDPLAGYDSWLAPSSFGAPGTDAPAVDRWVVENLTRLAGGGPALLGAHARDYEPNCALCHVRGAALALSPDLPAAALQTATLQPLGLVRITRDATGLAQAQWDGAAFRADGSVDPEQFRLQAPSSAACGNCHGIAQGRDPQLRDWNVQARQTETTGQLFVAGRISDSTLNVANRATLTRPWDVHAERMLACRDCHFSPNDPSSAFRSAAASPAHLTHEVRDLPLGEFLRRPSHEFAKGHSTQGLVANDLDGTMRRCEDCHDAPRAHRWLPKADRHLEQIGCETCHIDALHAPARSVTDYSVIDRAGSPRREYRGMSGSWQDPAAYLPEHRPLWLRRLDASGSKRLLPYNVITSYFWIVDDAAGSHPAHLALLKRALYEQAGATAKLQELLDIDRDGQLSEDERALTTPAAVEAVQAMLVAAGANNPRLVGEMQPYGIHHGVAPARFALRSCDACHGEHSRLQQPYVLATRAPYGVVPVMVRDSNIVPAYVLSAASNGQVSLTLDMPRLGLHVFGVSRESWLDRLGLAAVGLVLAGALGHGALRLWSSRKRRST